MSDKIVDVGAIQVCFAGSGAAVHPKRRRKSRGRSIGYSRTNGLIRPRPTWAFSCGNPTALCQPEPGEVVWTWLAARMDVSSPRAKVGRRVRPLAST